MTTLETPVRRVWWLVALVGVIAFAVALWFRGSGGAPVDPRGMAPSMAMMARHFNMLRTQDSNECGRDGSDILAMPAAERLQGSCCTAMDFHRYVQQRRGLRPYADISIVPSDPYDIPVALAKELVSYDRSIRLTPNEQRLYDRAMEASEGHGPCCCRCWRWEAFEGQAKYLLTRLHYSPREVAGVWELEDGCGGA